MCESEREKTFDFNLNLGAQKKVDREPLLS